MTEISTWRQAPPQQLLILDYGSTTVRGAPATFQIFVIPSKWEQLKVTVVSSSDVSLAALYAPFADEDSRLAAEGLDHFARSLEAEDAIE